MKKLFLSLLVACTVVGAASAQEYMSIGLGYASDTYNWTATGVDRSLNFQSLGVVLEGFTGDTLGLYSAASIGVITKGTETIGSLSGDVSFTPYEVKVHFDALLGLGYRFVSGDFDFIVAGGVGFGSTYLIPSDDYAYYYDSITYMTLGPGATVAAAYNLSPKAALYASMRGFYGVAQITEFTSTFTNSVVISPSAGLRIRVR